MATVDQPPRDHGGRKISVGGKSNSSSGRKVSLTETSAEKARRNLTTKANPTVAMDEMPPSMCLYAFFFFFLVIFCLSVVQIWLRGNSRISDH